jgi:hypothetical protein
MVNRQDRKEKIAIIPKVILMLDISEISKNIL